MIQIPVLSFGFTSDTGHIRIPVTNFEFTPRAIQGYIAIFTSEDPRCHNYYHLSKVTGTVERKDVHVCEPKDERESRRKRERGRDNSLGDRTPDIPITTVPVFREGLSRETTSHPPPKDSKILDCNEHIIITDTAHQLTSDTDLSLFDIHQGLADSDSGNFVNQLSGTTISRVAFPNAESLINQEHPPRTQQDVSLQSTHLGNLELTEPPRKKLGMTSRLMSTVETQGEAPLDLNLTKPPPPTHANKQPSRAIEQSAKIMAEQTKTMLESNVTVIDKSTTITAHLTAPTKEQDSTAILKAILTSNTPKPTATTTVSAESTREDTDNIGEQNTDYHPMGNRERDYHHPSVRCAWDATAQQGNVPKFHFDDTPTCPGFTPCVPGNPYTNIKDRYEFISAEPTHTTTTGLQEDILFTNINERLEETIVVHHEVSCLDTQDTSATQPGIPVDKPMKSTQTRLTQFVTSIRRVQQLTQSLRTRIISLVTRPENDQTASVEATANFYTILPEEPTQLPSSATSPVSEGTLLALDSLDAQQRSDIKRMMGKEPLLSQKTAVEIVQQPQADIEQVPDYFEGTDLSDAKMPAFLKGYRIDMDKCKISRAQVNLFIYEACVLPPRREDLFSPDNIPGRLKDFEVNTSNMRLLNYEPWSAHLRSAPPADKKAISDICQKNLELGLIEESNSEYTSPVILVRKATGRHQVAACLTDLNKQSAKDSYPLPLLHDNLNCLANSTFLSSVDICETYLSIAIAEE